MRNILFAQILLLFVTHLYANSVKIDRMLDFKCPFHTYSITDVASSRQLYTVCYDYDTKTSIYSQHKLRYYTTASPGSFSWRTSGLLTGNQNVCLGRDQIASHLNTLKNGSPTYDRGHLTPNADFGTSAERYGTYEVINSTPQLTKLNQEDWRYLEDYIRGLSATGDIDVVTGVLGKLEHNGSPIHLMNCVDPTDAKYRKFSTIGEFIYKVIRVNNPIAPRVFAYVAYNGWGTANFSKLNSACSPLTGGAVYSCDPKLFINNNLPTFKQFFNV